MGEIVTNLIGVAQPAEVDDPFARTLNLASSLRDVDVFSLELASSKRGATFMVRAPEGAAIEGTIRAQYTDGAVYAVRPEDDPMCLADDERMWTHSLTVSGPELMPLRLPGSEVEATPDGDPLVGVVGALNSLGGVVRAIVRITLSPAPRELFLIKHQEEFAEHSEDPARRGSQDRTGPSWSWFLFALAFATGILCISSYILGQHLHPLGFIVAEISLWTAVVLLVVAAVVSFVRWRRRREITVHFHDPDLAKRRVESVPFEMLLQVHVVLAGHDTSAERAREFAATIIRFYRLFGQDGRSPVPR